MTRPIMIPQVPLIELYRRELAIPEEHRYITIFPNGAVYSSVKPIKKEPAPPKVTFHGHYVMKDGSPVEPQTIDLEQPF